MNILHINMSLDPVTGGGTVERVRQLHNSMKKMGGVSSRVLSISVAEPSEQLVSEEIVLLPCWNRRWYLPAPRFLMMYHLVKWADVIHFMNHWTILNAIIYVFARITGTPYVICPAGALPVFGRSSKFKHYYNRLVGISLVRNCHAAIVVTKDESASLYQYGVHKERIFHIPNGVRAEDFSYSDSKLFRQHIGLEHESYLLFVGRLNEIKGPDLLLRAFIAVSDRFPSLHLVFIGPDGGMLDTLKSSARAVNLEHRICFAGYAGNELKSSAYHGASLLVIPSRQEAMSIVALEGAVCATAVLLTDQCGFSELSDMGAGIVAEASIPALSAGIEKLMQNEPMRSEMGRVGQKFALENYTWDIAAKKYLDVFKKLDA